MKIHKVGDLLLDGRKILEVDNSLRRYDNKGDITAIGVEYKYIKQNEGDSAFIRKFQNWS